MPTFDFAPTPPTPQRRPIVHEAHGDRRPDDYHWLKDRDDPAVRAHLEAENAYAEAVLAPLKPFAGRLYDEMLARIQQTDLSVPYRHVGWLWFSRTEEGRQYPQYCRRRAPEAAEETVLDLNLLAEGHPVLTLGAYSPSDDGHLLAYSTDTTGAREYTLRVKDLRTGALLPDVIEGVAGVAWAADGRTLFYVTEDDAKRPCRLWRHTLGEPAPGTLLFEEPDERYRVGIGRLRSREHLVLYVGSHQSSELHLLRADEPQGAFRLLLPRREQVEYDIEHGDGTLYLRINDTGRNFRLVAAPADDPSAARWTELVPHRERVMLEGIDRFANHLVRWEREDGIPRIVVTSLADGAEHAVTFPEPVYEVHPGANAEYGTGTLRFVYESMVTPGSVFDYDMRTRERTLLKQTPVLGGYDPDAYVSERLHATAPDGTAVPISLVRRRDTPADGTAPCYLEGYGAYGIVYPATFSSARLSFLDRGLVVAIAHVRGGGDLGVPWHDAGRLAHKMHSFTDFLACADHLVATGHAAPDLIVCEGGSAGGLLVGAAMNLRPDRFRAVLAIVPFVDVLSTMSDASLPLTVGEYEEWGNPGIAEQYAWMRAYCPWSNIAPVRHPLVYARGGINDSQVGYWEPAKWIAKLRDVSAGGGPFLLLTNLGAGHAGASGRYDRLREASMDFAVLLAAVGRAEG